MSGFICPVCGGELNGDLKGLSCRQNHHFDRAKSGYVNLLLKNQPKARRHGDDKLMLVSRRDFLNKGYYRPLLDAVCETIGEYASDRMKILDAGCGECYFTASIYGYLVKNGIEAEVLAVDISKDALVLGAKRSRELELAVASVFRLPVRGESCDMLFSVFAPFGPEEFCRVLKKGGVMIRVIPLERHLWSLKRAVYDEPYVNRVDRSVPDGFELVKSREVRGAIRLPCGEDIENVFRMTPYYYKTGEKDQKKLQELHELDTEIEFGIEVYRKK